MQVASPLALALEESETTLRLRLTGEFDLAGVRAVENALGHHAEGPTPKRVVFDLQDLDFLDLAGLRTILKANESGREQGFEVVVVRPRGLAKRVFTLTRAGKELSMVDDLEAA